MKKMYFMSISIIICAFLFVGCSQTDVSKLDTEKVVSGNSTTIEPADSNDQEEDVGKETPIVNPPVEPEPDFGGEIYGEGYSFRLAFGGALGGFPWSVYNKELNPVLISNKQELNEVFGETYTHAFDNANNTWIKTTDFQDLMGKYNDEYFEKHLLLTYVIRKGGSAFRFELVSVKHEQDILTVCLNYVSIGMGTAAMEQEFSFIEISKIPDETRVEFEVLRNYPYKPSDPSKDWSGTYYKL